MPWHAVAQWSGQGGGWDPAAREFEQRRGGHDRGFSGGGDGTMATPQQRNATLDQLNRILATPQLPVLDRLVYLNLRAFQYSRLDREPEAQKDIAEMAKVLPQAWQIVLSSTTAGLAGGGDRASALRLLDYGLSRKPGDTSLIIGQAEIYMQLADHPRAASLLDGAVSSAPAESDRQFALFMRGLANFNLGNFARSSEDFDATLSTRSTLKERLSPTLWRYAAHVRARRDAKGTLTRSIGSENLHEWPGPIARFLLGQISAGELEVAAESDENAKKSNGKCIAPFFVGMDAVRRGDRQIAREKFQLTQARCSTITSTNWAAASELKRL
jgi:tetratricopeptide (TPR) repeat protein